jgi:rare lipoprotein A
LPSKSARNARVLTLLAVVSLSACASRGLEPLAGTGEPIGSMRPYEVGGQRYEPRVYSHYDETGLASWYSYPPRTRRTADGEWFDARALTAAHKTLPLPSLVEVTNLDNGRRIEVRVNDRGPFVAGRIIDLSRAAADRLGFAGQGTAHVRVRLIGVADSAQNELAAVEPDPLPGLRGEEGLGLRGRL